MGLNLFEDWAEIVSILAPNHVGLGDIVSQERGKAGERFIMDKLHSKKYVVTSYRNSLTQGDVWAIASHTFDGRAVTSIVLVQVKTSASGKYPFSEKAKVALKKLVEDVRDRLTKSKDSDNLPQLRSNSRLVVSGWLANVKDDNGCFLLDEAVCISKVGRGAEDDSTEEQRELRATVAKRVERLLH